MEEKMMVVHCRVPSALVKEDIVPYVRRKLRGIPGLWPATMCLLQYLPTLESGWWSASVRCVCETGAIRDIERNPIVRHIEEYAPPPPPRPYIAEKDDDLRDEPPGGVSASPGPFIEPIETMVRIAAKVILPPFDFAYAVRRRVRSRYYRHFA